METTQVLFTRKDLEHWVDPMALRRGASCFKNGGVGVPEVSAPMPGTVRVQARVDDGAIYPSVTALEWDGRELRSRCDCPLGSGCKHAVALALAVLENPIEVPQSAPIETSRFAPGQDVILYGLWPAPVPKKLESLYRRPYSLWLALDATRIREDGTPGNPRPMQLWGPPPKGLSEEDRAIVELVSPFFRERGRDFSSPHARGIPLLEEQVDPILRLLKGHPFVFGTGRRQLLVHPDAPIPFRPLSSWQQDEGVLDLNGSLVAVVPGRLVGADPEWVLLEDSFHPVVRQEVLAEPVVPRPLHDGGPDLPATSSHPQLAPVPRLTLHEEGRTLVARLTFVYGTALPIGPADPRRTVSGEWEGQWGFWTRDPQVETAVMKRLSKAGLDGRGEGEWVGWDDVALSFLMDEVPQLLEDGWQIFGEERLSGLRVDRRRTSVSVGISSGTDWFDLQTTISIDGVAVDAASVMAALRSGSRFVRLGSGEYARLPEAWLARQQTLSEALGVETEDLGDLLRQRLPRYHALAAEDLMRSADEAKADETWWSFVDVLRNLERIPEQPVPLGFEGELRTYQRRGLDYLCFLRENGLNGILADDMGLGKTIQAIALLLTEKAAGRTGPSLLVAPTSVLYNWERELARFAPELKTIVMHGPDRKSRFEEIPQADIIVTSYTLLRRDFNELREHGFNYVILDEAQMIKNPRSQAARSACRLRSRHRLCLTGTPIENNLLELWSLFHFLMPGYLGSEKHFRLSYLTTGQLEPNPDDLDALRRLTRPFILRRLKQEVATDLPPRTEIVSVCELDEPHRRFYDDVLNQVRLEVLGTVDKVGINRSRFNVLEGLLRLRQACCDPQLVRPDLNIPSSKVEHFMALVSEIVAEGHRVLVFSQFVKVLRILEKKLQGEGITYEYLDGQTKDRLERVERFNAGTTPVFLISLKAGGTGLNLTGADYVIHFDPWWNPAVEDQATDRAHRIGQTRHVFAYKLIAKDTVEEKVLSLQRRKRQIVKEMLEVDALSRTLTREDLEYLFS